MTQHILLDRTADEVLWFQRRSFIKAAASWTAMGGAAAAHAQQRSNVVEMVGDITVNGERLMPQRALQTGDQIATGPDSHMVFVVGNSSFLVRQNSRLAVERGRTLNTVSLLRMLTGAVASVWGPGSNRRIVTPTLTAGIRGTGVYTEVLPDQGYRSYFCNCYGTVDMAAGGDRLVSQSNYHQSFWGEAQARNGRFLTPAGAINHTDEELEYLARLVNQQTAWQVLGRKGVKDGKGYMEERPPEAYPASPLR
ncbi:MAG: FecR family protein [Ramlibacter sp.]|nr:FecR family protein [Ramlibacter sp.]